MKVWGVVNSLLRKRGSAREDPVSCFPKSSSAMSSIGNMVLSTRM